MIRAEVIPARPRGWGRAAALFTLLLWLPLAAPACPAQEFISLADEYIENTIRAHRFSGSVLIARAGRVLFSKGYGLANVEQETPNTPRTKFRLGSLTKQFTAAAIMLLQERGQLDGRDPICKYLRDCPAAWQPITIRHLLTHTSGIPNFTEAADYKEGMTLHTPVARTVARFKDRALVFEPGARFSYSNSGYILLGLIIEAVSGESYEAFLQKHIFRPLRMLDTGYDVNSRIIKQRAAGYYSRGDTLVNAPYLDMSIPYAAGGLYSTTEDLHLWDQAISSERLLSKKSLEEIFTPFKAGYGYGWHVGEHYGRRYISHGGWIEGFATAIARFPDERVTVIVLGNLNSAPVNTMARNLGALAFGMRADAPQQRRAVEIDPALYDAYVGQYEVTPTFVITIFREERRLMGQAAGYSKIELLPESKTDFFVREYDAQITFAGSDKGAVTHAVLRLNGWETRARKIR